jgi:hypothetical protein
MNDSDCSGRKRTHGAARPTTHVRMAVADAVHRLDAKGL